MYSLINEVVQKRLFFGNEIKDFGNSIANDEAEADLLYSKIQEIRKISYELAEKMRSERLSKHKAKKRLHEKYPSLTSDSIDILIGDALFNSR